MRTPEFKPQGFCRNPKSDKNPMSCLIVLDKYSGYKSRSTLRSLSLNPRCLAYMNSDDLYELNPPVYVDTGGA